MWRVVPSPFPHHRSISGGNILTLTFDPDENNINDGISSLPFHDQEDRKMKKALFTKQFTTSFSAETYDWIRDICNLKEISMGEWIREAAEEKMKNDQNRMKEERNHEQP